MIRAYSIGMGPASISFIMLPIFLITGKPLEGFIADLLFVASWVINIAIAEWVIRRSAPSAIKRPRKSAPPAPLPPLPSSLR